METGGSEMEDHRGAKGKVSTLDLVRIPREVKRGKGRDKDTHELETTTELSSY